MTSHVGNCTQTVAADSSCTLASYTFTTGTVPTTSTDICQCAGYPLIYIINWINPPTGTPTLNGPLEIKSDVFEYIDAPPGTAADVPELASFLLVGIGLLALAVAVGKSGAIRFSKDTVLSDWPVVWETKAPTRTAAESGDQQQSASGR